MTPTECPQCAGPSRVLATVRHRTTVGIVYRCQRCGHKVGKLALGPFDEPDVHDFIRKRLATMLKPAPSRRSAP